MLHPLSIPADLEDWIESAVTVDSPATLQQSQFPAMVASMLVVRLAGEVSLAGQPVPASAWISPSRALRRFQHHGSVRAVGLVLRPEAAVCLWPATRGCVDTVRPVQSVAGPDWAALPPRIHGAHRDEDRLAELFQFIRSAAAAGPAMATQRRQVLALIDRACTPAEHRSEADGVGRRQFERRFCALLGMAPKQFQLIARHNRTLRQAVADPARPGAQLAQEGDYFDQSHMTRDMRRFAGHPLRELVGGPRPASGEHWPLSVGAAAHQDARPRRSR